MLQEFKTFINKGNVLAVAVGLVMALYFQEIVNAILDGVIKPIIAAIFGEPSLGSVGFHLGDENDPDTPFLSIGLVIDAAIMFLIVAWILFLIVRLWNKHQTEGPAGPTEVELLTEIRDSLRNR